MIVIILKKLYEMDYIAYDKPNFGFYYDFFFTYYFGSFVFGKIILVEGISEKSISMTKLTPSNRQMKWVIYLVQIATMPS